MQCQRHMDFCSITVLVQWSLRTPAVTEPGQVSHILGVVEFLEPSRAAESNVPSAVTEFPAQLRGLAQTVIEVSIILQGILAVDSHLLALFLTSFCF